MKIANVKLSYEANSYSRKGVPTSIKDMIVGALVLESLATAEFVQLFKENAAESGVTPENAENWFSNNYNSFYVNLDKLFGTQVWKFLEIISVLENSREEYTLAEYASSANEVKNPGVYNEICNVAVGGSTIHITNVKVFTDLCTEELQTKLDEGWRIVAVCVQPNQRRPDYILGK
jgi:hypothetical protein